MDHKQDYLVQIKIPIKALDDIEARHLLNNMRMDWNQVISDDKIKLQRIEEGKKPVGVKIDIGTIVKDFNLISGMTGIGVSIDHLC